MTLDPGFDDVVQQQADRLADGDRYGAAADLMRTAVRVKAGLPASGRDTTDWSDIEEILGIEPWDGNHPASGMEAQDSEDQGVSDGYLKEMDGLYDGLGLSDGPQKGYLESLEEDQADDGRLGGSYEFGIAGHYHDPIVVGPTADDMTPSVDVTDEQRYGAWKQVFDSMTDA